ncbi:MAG: hypothetical protein HYU51_08490 [Candidatus Rokubacteria bacterium]|nr:hypothetical protein [Candidatus Rokubacteria bacterium]
MAFHLDHREFNLNDVDRHDVLRWAGACVLALASMSVALVDGWTVRDLVWSFWLTTLTSGIFLSVVPALGWGILAASHPLGRPHWLGILVLVTGLSAFYVAVLVLFHQFFLDFAGGFVPGLHERPRVAVVRADGLRMLTFAESKPVFYWRSLAACAEAYWPFALATLAADAHGLPRTLDGWRGTNPLAATSQLGPRFTRLMVIQAALLLLYIVAGLRESIAFAVLFFLIHFLPSGLRSGSVQRPTCYPQAHGQSARDDRPDHGP